MIPEYQSQKVSRLNADMQYMAGTLANIVFCFSALIEMNELNIRAGLTWFEISKILSEEILELRKIIKEIRSQEMTDQHNVLLLEIAPAAIDSMEAILDDLNSMTADLHGAIDREMKILKANSWENVSKTLFRIRSSLYTLFYAMRDAIGRAEFDAIIQKAEPHYRLLDGLWLEEPRSLVYFLKNAPGNIEAVSSCHHSTRGDQGPRWPFE